jgi:hypothetical protein
MQETGSQQTTCTAKYKKATQRVAFSFQLKRNPHSVRVSFKGEGSQVMFLCALLLELLGFGATHVRLFGSILIPR